MNLLLISSIVFLVVLGNWKSKKLGDKFRLNLVLFYISTSLMFIYYIAILWNIKNLTLLSNILFLSLFPITYTSISLVAICFCAWKKGGFRNLSDSPSKGLNFGLVCGMVSGMIGGVVMGLIASLAVGMISGLAIGLTFGLVCGMIGGLISGVEDELK
ncbi:MAG: hypothetical protein ABIH79_01075 [archaeon]